MDASQNNFLSLFWESPFLLCECLLVLSISAVSALPFMEGFFGTHLVRGDWHSSAYTSKSDKHKHFQNFCKCSGNIDFGLACSNIYK